MSSINTTLVGTIRKFNRFYTNILGLLDRHMLDSEFSLSEARVLYEIGHTKNCTAKNLMQELSMDSGYLSRIVKHFEKQGLIDRRQSTEDRRLYYLCLTDKGQKTLIDLNGLSDRYISNMIAKLQEEDLGKLVDSMKAIENVLSGKTALIGDEIVLRSELRAGDVGELIQLHGWIYEKECGYNYVFEGYVCKTFYDFYQNYSPNKDKFWLAEVSGKIVGAIAIVGHSETRAQLRWFILHPDYRGIGLGSRLLNEAIQYCRDKGYTNVFLETTEDQKTAVAMYRKAGFKKVKEFENNAWGKSLVEQNYELELS